ncbi:caspase family protein [Nostoc sp. CENA67]|uniref:Caspase family protein n=1 Tax=Amazonocrinis nigriterrae CENA67 TaxID=2794033 RepID=A0A8J7HUQ7_9NOST|nr:caspase family protein [Amazonocrinis nigriterrae]MBH8565927.1 caspase family protein [Amazonocrinis nigriterrae CENA67]
MSKFSRNLAFVIGINNYGNGISSLQNAVNDAKKLVEVLRQQHQYHIWVCLDEIATLKNLHELLDKTLPQQVQPDDRLLFYFAGHGIALNGEDGPEGYLIPHDAKLGDVQTYLPMTQLQAAFDKLPCRHFLGILDCCFAGAFRWSSTRDFSTVPEVIYQERYDRFIQDPAWQIITSAAYDQKALDAFIINTERGRGTHSPFAAALLEALAGGADVYPAASHGQPAGDGVITATELYLYLRDRVEPATVGNRQRQTPGIWPLKKHDKGEYIFLTPGHVLNLPPAPPLDASQNPYLGLKSCEEEQSDLFFGRQTLTEKLHNFVSNQPLTVVLGASGSGKSSLVKAGLISYLKQLNTEPNQQQWYILPAIRPGESPLKALNNTLAQTNLPGVSITNFSTEEKVEIIHRRIAAFIQQYPNAKFLLIIDQLEEVITLCKDDKERENFLQLLAQIINNYANSLRIVLTLRSDFEPQFQDTALKQYWTNARFIVPQMTRIELRQAIEEPASKRVMYFQSENPKFPLIDRLIDEVADMPGALPLLSFTLSELYLKYLKRQQIAQINGTTIDRAITETDYQELGGVARSLTQRADSEYNQLVQLDPAYADSIRHVMLRMIAVGGGELARRRVPLSELEYPSIENQRVQEIIRRFTDARLLVEGQDTEGNLYVEPAHDALVRGWQKLLTWKQEQEEKLILQRRLTPAALEWQSVKNQKQTSELLTKFAPVISLLDTRLYRIEDLFFNKIKNLVVRKWPSIRNQQESLREKPVQFLWNANPYLDVLNRELQSNDNWFNQVEAEFVQQSVLQKRRNISLRWRIAIAVILSLSGLTIAALISQRSAKIGETTASRETAEVKQQEQGLDALVYSLRAAKLLQYPLLQLFSPGEQLQNQVRGTLQEAIYSVRERIRLEGQKGTVRSVLSPDNQLLVSVGDDDIIRLWNLQGHLDKEWPAQQSLVNNLAFSPDGKLIATAGRDDTVSLWDLQGNLVKKWKADQKYVKSITFSPNDQLLATGGANDTVRLWDLQGNPIGQPFARKLVPEQEEKLVWGVAFSPDDKIIASAGDDGVVDLWNLQGQLLREWPGNQDDISSIKFSPDGQRLATAGEDNTVRLWNLQGQQLGEPFRGHEGRVWNVVFSHDGQELASAAGDGTVRVWNLQGKQLDILIGHQGPVRSVIISKDGQLIVSAGDDGTVRLWNLNDQQVKFREHQGKVNSVSFSSDGQRIASAGDDATVRLWNLQGQQLAQPFQGHQGKVNSVSFSSDGQRIASAGDDATVRLWNLQGQQLAQPFQGHQGKVNSVSFSPDGQRIASAGDDGTIRLWNLQGQQLAQPFQGHQGKVNSVSFSPDGQQIASAGDDGTVRLWNLQGQSNPRTFTGHLGPVYAVAFSPDGKQIASAGDDATVRLWNLQSQQSLQPFQISGIKLKAVAFSRDGKMIAASGEKGTVQLWNLQGEKFAAWIGHRGSEIESVSFSPDGKLLATAGDDGIAELWHIESLNELIQGACDRLHDYLNNPTVSEGDRSLCKP